MIILYLISRGQSKDVKIVRFNVLDFGLKYMPVCVCVCVLYMGVKIRADLSFFVSVLQAQGIHGAHDCSQGLDGVAVNNRLVLLHIIAGETVLMDDPGHKERYRAVKLVANRRQLLDGCVPKEAVKEQGFAPRKDADNQTKENTEPPPGGSITSRQM